MRVVSWNAKLALDKKWSRLQALCPDLSIVQECASPQDLAARGVPIDPQRCLWTTKSDAKTTQKGLGVFPGEGVEIRQAPEWEAVVGRWAESPHRLDVLLPFEVIHPRRLNVLAVWSFNNRGRRGRAQMPGPVLVGVESMRDWLLAEPSMVIGDFNNHVRWDKPRNANSFACHVEAFSAMNFRSAYHHFEGCSHGEEVQDTHLWRPERSYHIDYAFASDAVLTGAGFRIEPLESWCGAGGVSDHAPLVLDLR